MNGPGFPTYITYIFICDIVCRCPCVSVVYMEEFIDENPAPDD